MDQVATWPGTGGQQIFSDALVQFAAQARDPRLALVRERLCAPLRVAVLGRPGVGRATVAAALADAGVPVVADVVGADACVLVAVEALKPEELTQLRVLSESAVAAVVVFNKADLAGWGSGGPLVGAEQRAARCATLTGLRVIPMIAHLATVTLDGEMASALRTLVTTPADMTSTDAFTGSEHPLPPEVRSGRGRDRVPSRAGILGPRARDRSGAGGVRPRV